MPTSIIDRILPGILAGGVLTTAAFWAIGASSDFSASDESAGASVPVATLLGPYKNIIVDGVLWDAVSEVAPVFYRFDPDLTQDLLMHLDKLLSTFASLRTGITKPAYVASALSARRQSRKRMDMLIRLVRRKQPILASDLTEGCKIINIAMDGHVHNCMQQSSLNLIES